jgi:hypothetical protein
MIFQYNTQYNSHSIQNPIRHKEERQQGMKYLPDYHFLQPTLQLVSSLDASIQIGEWVVGTVFLDPEKVDDFDMTQLKNYLVIYTLFVFNSVLVCQVLANFVKPTLGGAIILCLLTNLRSLRTKMTC